MTAKIVTRTEFEHMCGDVNGLVAWVDGNGKIGAKTRIKLLEDNWEKFDKKLDRMYGWLVGLVVSIVGSVIAAIIVWELTK